jgi:7-cyano-7-deazaguanine synthase in queuosine biosynthesis
VGTQNTEHVLTAEEGVQGDSSDRCVRILWTGGWDSTFRVLYATVVEGKRVEPHYIVDTGRPSSLQELRTISRIRHALRVHNKQAHERISYLQITLRNEIPEDIQITNCWNRLRNRMDLARQYDWLARYAQSRNLTTLELGVEKHDRDDGVYPFLKENIERTPLEVYRIKQGAAVDAELFARFEFPLFDYSKTQMRNVAEQQGFLEILEKYWFCHEPINGRPCGMCHPCVSVVAEGMGYRLTKEALFRCNLVQFVRNSPLSKFNFPRKVYHWIRHGSAGA